MKRHPRSIIVDKAKLAIHEVVLEQDLTILETIQILTEIIQSTLKWGLRKERHGRTDIGYDEDVNGT